MSIPRSRHSTGSRRRLIAAPVALLIAATLVAPVTSGTPAAAAAAPVNLARTGAATASSVELDRADFVAAHVNDGDRNTRWSSKYQDANWVQVRLATPATVDHVVLAWPNACARDFTLQTSANGTTWTDVARVQRDTCPRTDVIAVNSAQPVSHVRMQGHQRWAGYGYSISEFEIWNETAPPPAPSLGLLPRPASMTENGGTPYTLDRNTPIVAVGAQATAPATYLAGQLRPATGYGLPVVTQSTAPAPIVIEVGAGKGPAGHAAEGYRLVVTTAKVQISADTANGALNGVQTLRQLLPQWVESDTFVDATWRVPTVTISDYPRFAHRGMMLDVARSFYPVNEIKAYIDGAAQYKINRLHLHLTDDQGWRIALDNPASNPAGIDYGLLTTVSGRTAMTPGPYLHIGGDEAHVTSHANYTTMVNAFTSTVASLGKTVVGWNEYAGTTLPQNRAVVQYWNGDRTAVANAVTGRGAQVVLSPAPHTYVPQKQDSRQPLGGSWACGGPCGLDRHYNWDPGTFIPNIAETSVLGVESALWGEFIRRIGQAQYYSFPRLVATAEVGWTPQAQRDYADFTTRLSVAGGRLTVQGVNFFPTADVPWRKQAIGRPATATVGAPAGATWTVTAPGLRSADLGATVTWSDGRVEALTPTATREPSIPAMQINSAFTMVSRRTFGTPGTYTGTLSARSAGASPVEAALTVTVRAP